MRGKPPARFSGIPAYGLIPAYAGKTLTSARWTHPARAHPRVCGENRLPGSRRQAQRRLIPAYAGKTSRMGSQRRTWRAHPRVCGENVFLRCHDVDEAGSSPRMRGKPTYPQKDLEISRLIPAYAGKTDKLRQGRFQKEAHPRVCGENFWTDLASDGSHGSSPRMRGKRQAAHEAPGRDGLIPAYAGKTSSHKSSAGASAAHPRVCGENRCAGVLACRLTGSSPRMRGKQWL